MKVLSLFDGIGCGRVAIERCGIPVEQYVAYEIDKNAVNVALKNYPDIIEKGDVFNANFEEYKGFDLLIGGSPCTYWSIGQKTEKRETTNSGLGWDLFSQYVRALEDSGCPYFLYENNYSMDSKIKDEITKAFNKVMESRKNKYPSDSIQYKASKEIYPIFINSSLVSGQSRKRLYWTNIPCNGNDIMPIDKGIKLQDILEFGYVDRDKSLCITRRYAGMSGVEAFLCRRYFGKSFGQAVFKSKEGRDKIYALYKQDQHFDDGTKVEKDITKRNIRRLTPLETERLQTLPDNYTKLDSLSDIKRIELVGNGWTVDVIAHLLKGFERYNNEL